MFNVHFVLVLHSSGDNPKPQSLNREGLKLAEGSGSRVK